MPLKKGSSHKTISRNVKEMVDTWKSKGKIGNSRPASKKKAIKQAVAISLKKAGKSKSAKSAKTTAMAKKKTSKKPMKLVRMARSHAHA